MDLGLALATRGFSGNGGMDTWGITSASSDAAVTAAPEASSNNSNNNSYGGAEDVERLDEDLEQGAYAEAARGDAAVQEFDDAVEGVEAAESRVSFVHVVAHVSPISVSVAISPVLGMVELSAISVTCVVADDDAS